MTLSACKSPGDSKNTQPGTRNQNGNQTGSATDAGNQPYPSGTPTNAPTSTCTPTPNPTGTATVTPRPNPSATTSPTSTPTPTPTRPSLTGDALIAYNTFVALRDHAGWWNHNTMGKMDSLDFLEILLSFEFVGDAVAGVASAIIEQTAVRNFYVRCKDYTKHPCSPDSEVDVFTYIEEKTLLSSRKGYIIEDGKDPYENLNWKVERAGRSKLDFSYLIRNHDPLWERAFVDMPYEWGNASLMLGGIERAPLGNGTAEVLAFGGEGDTLYFLTACQLNHWGKPSPYGYGQDYRYGVEMCDEPEGWTQKRK